MMPTLSTWLLILRSIPGQNVSAGQRGDDSTEILCVFSMVYVLVGVGFLARRRMVFYAGLLVVGLVSFSTNGWGG